MVTASIRVVFQNREAFVNQGGNYNIKRGFPFVLLIIDHHCTLFTILLPGKLQNECIKKVRNEKRANFDLEDEDETQESSSSSIITPKGALPLLDKVHLFATYNENNYLQHRINGIITTTEGISICTKKQASITDFYH